MTNSIMFPLDDGHSHPTGPRPKVWCDYGGTDLYANGTTATPFSGGGSGIPPISYVKTVAPSGRTIKTMCPAGGFGGVWVLFDDLSELAVAFANGIVIDL